VQANLVNYLWPLGIVLMAPLFLPGLRLRRVHVLAALAGLAGAALAILGRSGTDGAQATGSTGSTDAGSEALAGYACALAAAFVWASYSLLSKRMAQTRHAYSTAAIGSFGLVSGVLAIACHWWLEPAAVLSTRDWILIAVLGLGPLGGAFYLWDAALKIGDARQIGVLSYLTPLLSTLILLRASGQPLSAPIGLATLLILGAAVLAARAR
jgi:drug/metabolite transporter (DMT)-like permease